MKPPSHSERTIRHSREGGNPEGKGGGSPPPSQSGPIPSPSPRGNMRGCQRSETQGLNTTAVIPSAIPYHSEAYPLSFRSGARNLPPSWNVRGLGGCIASERRSFQSSPSHVIPLHSHVIPSVARNLPPSQSVRGLGGCIATKPTHQHQTTNTPSFPSLKIMAIMVHPSTK